jgi:hypothetical protein
MFANGSVDCPGAVVQIVECYLRGGCQRRVFHGAPRYYPTPFGNEGELTAYPGGPEVMAELSVASRKVRSDA